jgi:hypothetical protein
VSTPPTIPGAAPTIPSAADLPARRRQAAERVAALTFDLGGLVSEMARRGDWRLDAITQRAATLRTADAELGELQRIAAIPGMGAGAQADGGQCRRCSASHARRAIYCWRCGEPLAYAVPPS